MEMFSNGLDFMFNNFILFYNLSQACLFLLASGIFQIPFRDDSSTWASSAGVFTSFLMIKFTGSLFNKRGLQGKTGSGKKKKMPELNVISGKPLKLFVSRLFIYKLEVMTPISPSCEICCEKISGQVDKKTWFSVCAAVGIWHTKWETPELTPNPDVCNNKLTYYLVWLPFIFCLLL